jgi:hypothetical protein
VQQEDLLEKLMVASKILDEQGARGARRLVVAPDSEIHKLLLESKEWKLIEDWGYALLFKRVKCDTKT